jgi:hypothetical protein
LYAAVRAESSLRYILSGTGTSLPLFIPKRILRVWPQFFREGTWLDFDELYAPLEQFVVSATHGFANDSESPVDLLGKSAA